MFSFPSRQNGEQVDEAQKIRFFLVFLEASAMQLVVVRRRGCLCTSVNGNFRFRVSTSITSMTGRSGERSPSPRTFTCGFSSRYVDVVHLQCCIGCLMGFLSDCGGWGVDDRGEDGVFGVCQQTLFRECCW